MTKPRNQNLFRFTLHGLEEMKLFPDNASREKALEELGSEVKYRDLALGVFLMAGSVIGAVLLARLVVGQLPSGTPRAIIRGLPLVFGAVTVWGSLFVLHRWGTREVLRKKLVRIGVPVCIKCGYLLRGIPQDKPTCPECGRAVDWNVRAILEKEASALSAAHTDKPAPS